MYKTLGNHPVKYCKDLYVQYFTDLYVKGCIVMSLPLISSIRSFDLGPAIERTVYIDVTS